MPWKIDHTHSRFVPAGTLGIGLVLVLAGWAAPATADQSGRTRWTSSALVGSPDPPLPYRVERIYPALQFTQPVTIVDLPGRDRRLVLQRDGKLLTFRPKDAVASTHPAGDVTDYEPNLQAALDLTLDPEFPSNGLVYIVWKGAPHFREDGARVVRFKLTDDADPSIDPESRLDIFIWPSGDHAGSTVRFGNDNMLYVTMGDGSGPFPPNALRTAQDLSDVRGSILRLDVRDATVDQPYRIPADNPFVNLPDARGEIFAFGFRNPWRMDFDPSNGTLYAGDVGWELWEMIHKVNSGGNYGWSITEGPQPIHEDEPSGPGPITAPEITLSHTESQSITGGEVMRSISPASLEGHYVCGDYVSGSIWAARITPEGLVENRKVAVTPLAIISFAAFDCDGDERDDLVVLDYGGGVYRLVDNQAPDTSNDFPRMLSQTGLFESMSPLVPTEGVVSLNPVATMWRDGASGERVVGIPNDGVIKTVNNRRRWVFPKGMVLANTISRDVLAGQDFAPRKIETQVLLFDGISWQPYTYQWNDSQDDASLVSSAGTSIDLVVRDARFGRRTMQHKFASRDQCRVCHHKNVPGGISFTPQNLVSATRNSMSWKQIVQAGLATATNNTGPPMVDPHDESYPLDRRARSYLSSNCAHCHQRGGGGSAAVVLSHHTKGADMNAIGVASGQGSFGLPAVHENGAASVIVPGHPEASVLMYRMSTIGSGRMPHLGSREVDPKGLKLVADWIASLDPDEAVHIDSTATSKLLADQQSWLRLDHESATAAAIAKSEGASDAVLRGLIDSFLPPPNRAQRIGDDPSVDALLRLTGNADQGRRWFADAASSQCRSCHVAGGVGQTIGPSLDGIGSRLSRAQILDGLLNPSAKIDPAWVTQAILTVDGRQIVGLKIEETEETVTLRSSNGKTSVIHRDDIEETFPQKQSLMPTGMVESMTETELADLLAYLESLRSP